MSKILLNANPELNPEVRELLEPLVAQWRVAVLRVAAAHSDSEFMPHAPKAGSPEAILAKRFDQISAGKKQAASRTAIKHLKDSKVQKRLGFKQADLKEAHSVEERTSLPSLPMTAERLGALSTELLTEGAVSVDPATSSGQSVRTLTLEMVRMVCVDETGWLEWGNDEISLGGSALRATTDDEKVKKIGPFDLGDFNDSGDSRQHDYSPYKKLVSFKLTSKQEYPQAFFATLALAEIDLGGFDETVRDLVNKLKEQVESKLSAILAGVLVGGGSVAGPVGALVGLAVGYVLGKIVNAIVKAWEDDVFNPVTVNMVMPKFSASFDGHGDLTQKSEVVYFTGPGEYAMRYRWVLSNSDD